MFAKKLIKFTLMALMIFSKVSFAIEVPIDDFSIQAYSQNSQDYLPPTSDDYTAALLNSGYQTAQLHQFYNHYFATDANGLSPWSAEMAAAVLPMVNNVEIKIIAEFDNSNKTTIERHYGENFKAHDETWLNKIKANMGLENLHSIEYTSKNNAIAVANTFARALPDEAPDFLHISLPGQGFPFDNLQQSAIWAGTPLYIITVSQDKAWSLVLTPDAYFSWVKSSDIAHVSHEFIQKWQMAAKKGLVAITETETAVLDKHSQFHFKGYIGAVFPLVKRDEQKTQFFIPVKNSNNSAEIITGVVDTKAASLMPLLASKKNIVKIIKQLQNRPYGWGGAFFYNDCSQEMKSLFTPFGIWLPRNSAQQARLNSTVDLSKNNLDERLSILKEKGHPLMTLVYIGGHVMLYIGHHEDEVMTYQNLWGLAPANRDKRYVVGQALFLPLLKYYPENPDISSLADKAIFKLVYLDALDIETVAPKTFSTYFTMKQDA